MKTSRVPNIWDRDDVAGFDSAYGDIDISDSLLPIFGIGYYNNNQNISILKITSVLKNQKNSKGDLLINFEFVKKFNLQSDKFNSRLPTQVRNKFLVDLSNDTFKNSFPEIVNDLESIIKNEIKLNNPLNIILFGPPGTGKTFSTKNKSNSIINNRDMENKILTKEEKKKLDEDFDKLSNDGRIKFITFHPSYSYEDFIEGIRPGINKEDVKFELKDGIFKKLCLTALQEYDERKTLKNWNDYKDDLKTYIDKNVTAMIKDETIKKYVLIIDEINRGDISKIFGELITLIEDDKRIGKDNQLIVQLPYSGNNFGIPPNLYIIGTMNTADRSLALLDIALRRRFDFIEMKPDFSDLKPGYFGIDENVSQELLSKNIRALQNINITLANNSDIGKDKMIGHAYFCNIKDDTQFVNVWKNRILPLLEEYYFFDKDDLEKKSNNFYKVSTGWNIKEIEKIIDYFSMISTAK